MRLRFGLAVLLLACLPVGGHAQRVEVRGRGDPILDDRIRRFLDDPATIVLTRDTLLVAGDTMRGPVAAVGISLRISGVVDGSLLIVDANVFVRPGGIVRGSVTNIAGGFWPSEFAAVDAEVEDHGRAPYDVERGDDFVRIVGLSRRQIIDPDGLRGLRVPTYDRVAGLTLGLGATWYPLRADRIEPRVRGWAGWALEREDWVGRLDIALLAGTSDFEVGVERITASSDRWNVGDLINSLSVVTTGSDYRDYYGAERVFARYRRFVGDWTLEAGALLEDAESLPAHNVWAVARPDSARSNPAIGDGRITSGLLGVSTTFGATRFQAEASGRLEGGTGFLDGHYDFVRYEADVTVAVQAFSNHTVEVRGRLQGPLATDSLPGQRWGILGGLETIETLDPGALRGDRLALVRTSYAIPLAVRVPLLGEPVLEMVHAAGSAWTQTRSARLDQALGLRLHFPLIYAFAFIDPEGDRDAAFGVAVRYRRHFPWESGFE